MWNEIADLALSLVRADRRYRDETLDDLKTWICDSAYPGARDPHASTRDLVYTFAASLLNSGRRGPQFEPTAAMIADAVSIEPRNDVVAAISLRELAIACGGVLERDEYRALAKNDLRYRKDLAALADGRAPSGVSLPLVLEAVSAFIGLLARQFGGCAAAYRQRFAAPVNPGASQCFVVERFAELADIRGVGVAVGVNFLKDSQLSALRGRPFEAIVEHQAGWFVKPDLHVMRLMLFGTGRCESDGYPVDLLHTLESRRFASMYRSTPLHGLHAPRYTLAEDRPPVERAAWCCIEDVHHWARVDGVAPVAFERLLYLIGSGRYRDPAKRISVSKEERYRRFVELLRRDELRGTPHVERPPAAPDTVVTPSVPGGADPGTARSIEMAAHERFYAKISSVQNACDFVDALEEAVSDREVEVHHTFTDGGDLRVRAFSSSSVRPHQNVVTFAWAPQQGRFRCKAYLPVAQCSVLGLDTTEHHLAPTRSGPLPTSFTFVPGRDDTAVLAVVQESILKFEKDWYE